MSAASSALRSARAGLIRFLTEDELRRAIDRLPSMGRLISKCAWPGFSFSSTPDTQSR